MQYSFNWNQLSLIAGVTFWRFYFRFFRGAIRGLAVENIDHARTKMKSPQTNGIVERFHRTVFNEFYRVAFRKKIYRSIEEVQQAERPDQGRWCFGKTRCRYSWIA